MSTEPSQLPTIVTDRYTIQKQIGAGGMATVYLARDTKHDREVALKVLRPELGAVLGADRFLSEIKITARLDHPHILTLIDSGAADGLLYYVLPYVRGESLRDLLQRETQLSIEDAIALTKQVGSALDYAHRHDVIHRDIKPENILIQEGEAILTDFGIALAVKEAGGSRLTQTGLSLGTPMYMSPEQATGEKSVGPKSDQYALAAVLYEMLTGEPPISGPSSQAIIAKLLTEEPTRIRTVRKTVPVAIDAAVAKALAKSPADRFATIGDFLRALDAARSATGAETVESEASPRKRSTLVLASAVVGVAAIAAFTAFALKGGSAPEAAPVTLRDRTQLTFSGSTMSPAISPDGKQLAYFVRSCPTEKCTYAITVQDVGSTESKVILDGLTAAYIVEWSPDRRNLIFLGSYAGRLNLFAISALGGRPRMIEGATSVTFSLDGDSLVVLDMNAEPDKDSLFTVKMTNLSGDVGSTFKVPAGGEIITGIIPIPNSNRVVVMFERESHTLWQIVERDGKVLSEVLNPCRCAGLASSDALWLARTGAAAGMAVVRIAIDSVTGKLAQRQDTVYNGRQSAFSVTADGTQLVVEDGTSEYNVTTASVADVMAGRFDASRTIQSSSVLSTMVSPDGKRVLKRLTVPDGRGSTLRLSVMPFDGGAERPVQADGRTLAAQWADSVSIQMATRQSDGINLSVVDVRTAARRNQLKLADSVFSGAAALPDGWVRIPRSQDRLIIQKDGASREVRKSPWHFRIEGLAVSPDYSHAMYWGPNAATMDSVGFVIVPLNGGEPTHAFTSFAEFYNGAWLDDGSFIAQVFETRDAITLTRVSLNRKTERLRTIPHFGREFSHSADFKRATFGWRETKTDAFMYQVVKQ